MTRAGPKAIHEIVWLAGGRVVGRTKLQKCACALELAGLGFGFAFSYKHFGPFSEEFKIACDDACALDLIQEQRKQASWGGEYSVFTASKMGAADDGCAVKSARRELLRIMAGADPIALELAVTAAFLADDGSLDPWGEVADRKEDRATPEAVDKAKKLYGAMSKVPVPRSLPAF